MNDMREPRSRLPHSNLCNYLDVSKSAVGNFIAVRVTRCGSSCKDVLNQVYNVIDVNRATTTREERIISSKTDELYPGPVSDCTFSDKVDILT